MTRNAKNLDAVFTRIGELYRCKIGDDIRRDVFVGIAHFIKELFFYGLNIDTPAGAVVLCDDEFTIGRRLDYRETDIRHIRDRLPIVLAVAAARLGTTFDNVPGDRPSRDLVPVVKSPAEFMYQRSERQARVGQASPDDDI